MITKIQQSILAKPIAVLLAFAFLSMSFTMKGNSNVVLNSGTGILLETVSTIQSDMISVGQTIDFRVAQDVKVDGKTVIAEGSMARGQILRADKAKGLGKQGFIEVQIKYVTAVDGQKIFLSGGNVYKEGEDRQTLAIVLGIFVCVLFLTMKGKNAQIPAGYQVNTFSASTTTIKV